MRVRPAAQQRRQSRAHRPCRRLPGLRLLQPRLYGDRRPESGQMAPTFKERTPARSCWIKKRSVQPRCEKRSVLGHVHASEGPSSLTLSLKERPFAARMANDDALPSGPSIRRLSARGEKRPLTGLRGARRNSYVALLWRKKSALCEPRRREGACGYSAASV